MSKEAKDASERRELESFILQHLAASTTIPDSLTFLTSTPFSHISHTLLSSTLQSLASSSLVSLTPLDHSSYTLTPEGDAAATHGTPEGQLLALLSSPSSSITTAHAEATLGKAAWEIARGKGMKDRWLLLDKDKGELRLKEGAAVTDALQPLLLQVRAGQADQLDAKLIVELKKRKMITLTSARMHTHTSGEWMGVGGGVLVSGDERCISSS